MDEVIVIHLITVKSSSILVGIFNAPRNVFCVSNIGVPMAAFFIPGGLY